MAPAIQRAIPSRGARPDGWRDGWHYAIEAVFGALLSLGAELRAAALRAPEPNAFVSRRPEPDAEGQPRHQTSRSATGQPHTQTWPPPRWPPPASRRSARS